VLFKAKPAGTFAVVFRSHLSYDTRGDFVKKKFIFPAVMFALVATFFLRPSFVAAYSPNITAPIAVVMDFYTGEILYERDMERRWVPASLTKIMSAFITYEEIAAGNLTLCTEIRVSAGAAAFSSDRRQQGSFVPLPAGAYVSVEVLLQLMMLPSANAASVVIAEHIYGGEAAFVERMNAEAVELGMYASFTNSHGAAVHHTNAYSVAILVREFIMRHPDILRITSMPNMNFRGSNYNNTNLVMTQHRVDGVDGFKTGTLRQAGWNHSTTAYRNGRRVIAIIMNAPNNVARHAQSRELIEFGFAELERREAERAARVRIFHGGAVVPLNTPPVFSRGRLMLPVRAMFERLGYVVQWHHEPRLVVLRREDEIITIFADRNLATINGQTYIMEMPAQFIDGRIFVSMEFVAILTGTSADWNEETGVVRFIEQVNL